MALTSKASDVEPSLDKFPYVVARRYDREKGNNATIQDEIRWCKKNISQTSRQWIYFAQEITNTVVLLDKKTTTKTETTMNFGFKSENDAIQFKLMWL